MISGSSTPGSGGARRAIIVAVWASTLANLTFFLVSTFAIEIRSELGIDERRFGLALSTRFILAALCAVGVGWYVTRHGPARAVRIGCVSMVAGSLGIAASQHWLVFTAFVAVAGFTASILNTSSDVLLAQQVPRERHGSAFGIKQGGAPVAALLAGLALPLAEGIISWRWVFVGCAIAAVGLLPLVPGRASPTSVGADGAEVHRDAVGDIGREPTIVLAIAMFFVGSALGGFAAFAVSGAIHAGVGESSAGLLFALGSVLAVVVRLAMGFSADRRSGGLLRRVAAMMAAGAVAYGVMTTDRPIAYYVGIPMAFASSFGFSGLFSLAIVRSNPNAPGRAVALTQTGANLGAMAGPPVFGLLAARSYSTTWTAACVLSAVAAAITIAGRALVRRDVAAMAWSAADALGTPGR